MKSLINANGTTTLNIPKEYKALFAALQLHDRQTEQLQRLSTSEWKALLSFCELAHLTFPLLQVRDSGFPDWVAEQLNKNAADNAKRFERIKATYTEAAKALGSAGVQYLVMKGFAKSPEFVNDPRLRVQSDIDLYCPQDSVQRARSALSAIGYYPDRTLDYKTADHLPSMFRDTGWIWRGNSFDPEMPLSIELHFCLWNKKNARFSVPNLDGFWGRRVMRSLEDFTFPAFSDVDNLGYSALQTLRDVLNGEWISHHVYELAVFLHRHAEDATFWAGWKELHSDSLRSLETIAFSLAKAWFRCDLSPEVKEEIARLSPAIHKWLDRFAGSPLEGMSRLNKDRLWLHLSLIESSREKCHLVRRMLFPTRIAGLNTPPVELSHRRPRKYWTSQKHLKWLMHFAIRLTEHTCALPPTLWHGFRWWTSQRQFER